MHKFIAGLGPLLIAAAATGAPASMPKPAPDVVICSAVPDQESLKNTWRADLITRGVKKRPPFNAQLKLYSGSQAAPAQTISLRVRSRLADLQVRMPDLDGDGQADLVVSSAVDPIYRHAADVVFLWSPTVGRFVRVPELSGRGGVNATGTPNCIMTETACGITSWEVGHICRDGSSGRWLKSPEPDAICADRD